MNLAAQPAGDSCGVGVQCRLGVDEVNRRLAADVSIPDEIAEHAGMVGCNRFGSAEAEEPARTSQPVAHLDVTGERPTLVGEDLVVGSDSQRVAALSTKAEHLLQALVEPGYDRPNV